jgi:DNA-binding transcriptional ArsR family regulator
MEYAIIDAFSNRVRLKLLCCLSKGGKNVQELIDTCNLAQSAVSQHLVKLKKSGLVINEREGKHVYYSITYSKIAKIACELEKFIQEIEKNEDLKS